MSNDPVKIVKLIAVALTVAFIMPVVTVGTALSAILLLPLPAPDLPTPKPNAESRISHVVDSTGAEIAVFRKFDTSITVEESDIPEVLKQAVVAAEDKRFYSHKGFDPLAAARAAWADIRGRTVVQGGSTITQQYIKTFYTGGERTFARKAREAVLASRLDRRVTKDAILYRYLSTIYFGGGAYGVGAAAESYFGKSVKDLNLSESAMLAGLISAPSDYEPRTNLAQAERNRLNVLDQMLDQDRITRAEHSDAKAQEIFVVSGDQPTPAGPATLIQPLDLQSSTQPYFVDYVRLYVSARYGDNLLYRGGLRIETTIDPRMQALAEESVRKALEGTSAPLEMAMVTVEPGTGFVKALVGGRDFEKLGVNLALGACKESKEPINLDAAICIPGGGTGRQPGSSFKPFTLARAFEEGIGPRRVYSGPGSYTIPKCVGSGCTVKNVESGSFGSITLREATQRSVNTVYAQLVGDVGITDTAEMAHRLGITMVSPDGVQPNGVPYGASLTLGAAEVSPLDMAAAYAVFANRGKQLPATPILKITDASGKILEDNTARVGRQVLAENVADNITDVLKGVITGGTGKGADIGRPEGTAGKTGSSEQNRDAWFVGYTPAYSTAIWMGYSDSNLRSLRNIKGVPIVYGGTIPASTWKDYMGNVLKDAPPADFPGAGPLAGDVSAGPRRMPLDLGPVEPEQYVLTPPVATVPPPTLVPPQPTFTLPPISLPNLFGTTTTVPRTTTTRPIGTTGTTRPTGTTGTTIFP